MKRTTPTESTQSQPGRPNWQRRLVRTSAMACVIALGAATVFVMATPADQAFAAQTGSDSHASFFAAMHAGHSPEDMHAHFDKVLTGAGASDAQKEQIHAIMKEAMTAEHTDMESFHAELKQMKILLTAAALDETAIAKVRDDQDRLMLATSHRVSDALIAAAKVLTPAQRAKLGGEIDRMMAGQGMHHHGG